MTDRPESLLPLRRRLFRRRVEAALTDRGSGLALGAVLLVTATAYVLGVRGVLAPAAWQAGLVAGGAFVLLRSVLRLFGGGDDPSLLRQVLIQHFGEEIRNDPDVSRLSRQAIEQRLQLATALAEASPQLARAGTALLPQRLTEVVRIADAADPIRVETARKAADGLSAQVAATVGLVAHAEDRLLALDHAVAEFGTTVAQALRALSKGDRATLDALARNASAAAPD